MIVNIYCRTNILWRSAPPAIGSSITRRRFGSGSPQRDPGRILGEIPAKIATVDRLGVVRSGKNSRTKSIACAKLFLLFMMLISKHNHCLNRDRGADDEAREHTAEDLASVGRRIARVAREPRDDPQSRDRPR